MADVKFESYLLEKEFGENSSLNGLNGRESHAVEVREP